jgi:hypothetical protein
MSKRRIPKPTEDSTDAWEKLPRRLQKLYLKRKVQPLILVGGDELFFAEITDDNELKVLATAQPDIHIGDVAIIDTAGDAANVSGEALHVKRGHADSAVLSETAAAVALDVQTAVRAAAQISATLDAYIYNISIWIRDPTAFFTISNEMLTLFLNIGGSAEFWKQIGFDKGHRCSQDASYFYSGDSWNFGSPLRVPAGTSVSITVINSSKSILDNLYVKVSYYHE